MHLVTGALISTVLLVGSAPSPADLISGVDGPAGFELADVQTGLTFAEYADLEPDAVAHVGAESADAAAMSAAIDIWTSSGDDIVLRQVVSWGDEGTAQRFVDQVARSATAEGLEATRSRVGGGVAFEGEDDAGVATQLTAWAQGGFGVVIELFSVDDRDDEIVSLQRDSFSNEIARVTGIVVAEGTGDDGASAPSTSSGGIPITTVLFWLLVVGGGIWLFVKIRRRISGPRRTSRAANRPDTADDADDDADEAIDDIIERARARSRARRDVDAIPDPTTDRTVARDD